jgi:hypothetical protein
LIEFAKKPERAVDRRACPAKPIDPLCGHRRSPVGAVEVVPDTAFKDGRAATLKDIVDYVPGV